MDGYDSDVLSRYVVPRHRLTVADYHRMGEAGILGEQDRVELLEGQLIAMSPIGPRHAFVVDMLNHLLGQVIRGRAWLRCQQPVTLDDGSEPQPDVVLVPTPAPGFPKAHPRPEEVLLLCEVADSSRGFDLGAKRAIYAGAGIREFWLVDLIEDCVIVCRDPANGGYLTERRIEPSGMLEVEALLGVAIPAAPLFS